MKTIAVDLDDTLCTRDKNHENLGVEKYRHCIPLRENIAKINKLYDEGNTIVIYTARGMSQFNGDVSKVYSNLYDLTLDQLVDWDVKFHGLVMGKIHYDIIIDDKCLRPEEL